LQAATPEVVLQPFKAFINKYMGSANALENMDFDQKFREKKIKSTKVRAYMDGGGKRTCAVK
jgi:hypothetical protein